MCSCGSSSPLFNRPRKEHALPKNPRVLAGQRMVYLGSALRVLRGPVSELEYHVAPTRRQFTADARDVDGLLRDKRVIVEP
jgi:hypothetical protein